MAEWLTCTRDEGYEVSDEGEIRRRDTGHILKPWPRPPRGYPTVRFGHRGKSYSVHTLVLEAFEGECPPGQEALHADDDPTNPRRGNLRWGTRAENLADRIANGQPHNNGSKTKCKRDHEFTPENTRITSKGSRQCRACVRIIAARKRQR